MVKHKVIHQMIFVFSVTLITLEITVKYRKVLSITIEQDVFQDIACFSKSFKVSVHPRSDFYRGHPMLDGLCKSQYTFNTLCILIEMQEYREKALRSLFKKMYVFETYLYFGTPLSKMKISYHKMYHFILPSLQK